MKRFTSLLTVRIPACFFQSYPQQAPDLIVNPNSGMSLHRRCDDAEHEPEGESDGSSQKEDIMGTIKACKLVYEPYPCRIENNGDCLEKLQAIRCVDIDIEKKGPVAVMSPDGRLQEIRCAQAHERSFLPNGWYQTQVGDMNTDG